MSIRSDLIREEIAREWELAQAGADRESEKIISEFTLRGMGRTGAVTLALYENDLAAIRKTLAKRIALEREHPLAKDDAEAEVWAAAAERDVRLLVGEAFGWLARRATGYCNRHLSRSQSFDQIFRGRLERERDGN